MKTNAKFASFLIIPLKYDCDYSEVAKDLPVSSLTTMDLTENVKDMLRPDSETAIGKFCHIGADMLKAAIKSNADDKLFVKSEDKLHPFEFIDSFLYIFKTQIAFLCLGISYDHMDVINTLSSTGHADNKAIVFPENSVKPLPIEDKITAFCKDFSLYKFFSAGSLFLESFVGTVAVFREYFDSLDELRRTTFKIHQMLPLDSVIDDESEEDTRYVYAVKSEEKNAYRWGYCVASQKLSYAVANNDMNFEAEVHDFAADGLPLAIFMLHEKYTCLRFTQLIAKKNKSRELSKLKRMMLEFQAFGIVSSANISRWHNIKQIYAHLLSSNDVENAVNDISTKISILTSQQDEIEAKRTDRMSNIITIFGLVSILDSVLSIFTALREGDPILWHCSTLTTSAVLVLLVIAARIKNR